MQCKLSIKLEIKRVSAIKTFSFLV